MKREQLNNLTGLAKSIGAEGIWLVRGAAGPRVLYYPDIQADDHCPRCGSDDVNDVPDYHSDLVDRFQCGACDFTWELTPIELDIADADLLVVMRFPKGDGGEPGIESR
ncbi:MAG: hypothetical protein KDJ52_00135 [Anaerolineae bacterium]|nr:hypothetical protein [Anaerolineae bacterium]